jgi:hypothetical protein
VFGGKDKVQTYSRKLRGVGFGIYSGGGGGGGGNSIKSCSIRPGSNKLQVINAANSFNHHLQVRTNLKKVNEELCKGITLFFKAFF